MRYPLVLDLAAEGVPVAVTCRVLGFSKQAFYAWRSAPVPQRDWDEAHLINAAIDIHADDPAFGYRFIAGELPARGITAGENKVARADLPPPAAYRETVILADKPAQDGRGGVGTVLALTAQAPVVHDDDLDLDLRSARRSVGLLIGDRRQSGLAKCPRPGTGRSGSRRLGSGSHRC